MYAAIAASLWYLHQSSNISGVLVCWFYMCITMYLSCSIYLDVSKSNLLRLKSLAFIGCVCIYVCMYVDIYMYVHIDTLHVRISVYVCVREHRRVVKLSNGSMILLLCHRPSPCRSSVFFYFILIS
jgi:hypothetical protein